MGTMKKQINAERKKYATKIARKVARVLKSPQPSPVCNQITSRRGHALCGGDTFSVPAWIFDAHPVYQLFYIAHETCHSVTGRNDGDSIFRYAENEVAEAFGYKLIYGNGFYPVRIEDKKSGATICDGHGRSA